MYQRAQVRGRRLCYGLTGVCLLLLFAISQAKASPLAPPPPPTPLAPLVLNGTPFFNLVPRVDFADFGNYSLFQPPPPGKSDYSIMSFRVFSFAPGVDPANSFQFSEGIGNSSIPEPSSVFLLSTGAIVIDLLHRRSGLRRLATPGVAVRWSLEGYSGLRESGVRRERIQP